MITQNGEHDNTTQIKNSKTQNIIRLTNLVA